MATSDRYHLLRQYLSTIARRAGFGTVQYYAHPGRHASIPTVEGMVLPQFAHTGESPDGSQQRGAAKSTEILRWSKGQSVRAR